MKSWHVVVFLLGLNYLLFFGVAELNHVLARWSLTLHAEALLLLFPALFLAPAQSLLLCFLLALMVGVHYPAPLGATILSFLVLFHLGAWMRHRIRRENAAHLAGLGTALQVVFLLAWSLGFARHAVAPGAYWVRVGADTLISGAVVALLAGWWCRWQFRLLGEFGWEATEK